MSSLGGGSHPHTARPQMELSDLDDRTHFLQVNSIEKSTAKGYATGARDYISFCINHSLPLDPTPQTLSRYIGYTSQFISSGPKYLSGARHFLSDLYPSFNTNRSHHKGTSGSIYGTLGRGGGVPQGLTEFFGRRKILYLWPT